MQEIRDDKYFECYKVIYNTIVDAYKDVYILKYFFEHGKDIPTASPALIEVLTQIRNLAIKDLCLAVWKLSIDDDPKAASIEQLKMIVRNKQKAMTKRTYPLKIKHMEKDLSSLRNSSLAHADQAQFKGSITIPNLFDALDCIREMMNDMCYPDLDSRVEIMTKNRIYAGINYNFVSGMSLIFQGISNVVTNLQGSDDDNA